MFGQALDWPLAARPLSCVVRSDRIVSLHVGCNIQHPIRYVATSGGRARHGPPDILVVESGHHPHHQPLQTGSRDEGISLPLKCLSTRC